MVRLQGIEESWMEPGRIKIKTFLLSLAAIIFLESVAAVTVTESHLSPMIILGVARLMEIILIVLIIMKTEKGLSVIGFVPGSIVRGFKRGLIWSGMFGLATLLVALVLFLAGINPLNLIHSPVPARPDGIIMYFMVGCIVGPVTEEFFFRGMLYGFFRRWGIPAALILTTILFILAHGASSAIPVTQAIGGIIFAISYEVEASLMVPIIIHILGNTAMFSLSLIR